MERDSVQLGLQAAEEWEELPGDLRQPMMGELILNPPDQPLRARVAWFSRYSLLRLTHGYWHDVKPRGSAAEQGCRASGAAGTMRLRCT